MSDVSSRSRVPPTSSGCATIASRIVRSDAARPCRGSPAGTASGSARKAYARATDARGKAKVSTPQPSIAVRSRSGVVAKARATAARSRDLGRMAGVPVVLQTPVAEAGQEEHRRVIAGAHVADRARLLAIPGEPRAAVSGVERRPRRRRRRAASAVIPDRRKTAWSVRTWRSSPECELAMTAISAGSGRSRGSPPASTRASRPNGLTHERRVDVHLGVAGDVGHRPAASTRTT